MAAEVRLRQALVFTEKEDDGSTPNKFRLATVFKCFDDLSVLCGAHYAVLFDTIRAEVGGRSNSRGSRFAPRIRSRCCGSSTTLLPRSDPC
eukprot:5417865-Prymnesium_polylepis.1